MFDNCLKILGSSSKGNCYLLQTEKETLILECGVGINSIKKALNYDFSNIIGCLITHEHGDHAKSVSKLNSLGVDIYSTPKTLQTLKIKGYGLNYNKTYKIGNFTIRPFKTVHDAVDPACYLISHKEIGNILFVTDTNNVPVFSENIDLFLIECNHDENILTKNLFSGKLPTFLHNRIKESHLSLQNLKKYFTDRKLKSTSEIILIHLSKSNADESICKNEIQKITGIPVKIAKY